MAEIFLSYRRQDSRSATGRLEDALRARFGEETVFRDHDSIAAGEDFVAAIHRAVGTSTVLLAVIGPGWLDARDGAGKRRLDDGGDFVRLEIASALQDGVPVIPVLVEGASMPPEAALPADLQALSRCQAVELGDTRWQRDAEQLADILQQRFAIESQPSAAGTGVPASATLNLLERIALDMLELLTHPRRLIISRQTGRALDHLRAFLFLCVCLVLGNLAIASAVEGVLSALQWVAFGLIAGLLLVTLLAVPLWISWRITGLRVEFKQVSFIFAYLYGMAWLGFCAGAVILAMGAQLARPAVFAHLAASGLTMAQRMEAVNALAAGGPAVGGALIAGLVWLSVLIWIVAAWGTFRIGLGASRWRAVLATSVWLAMLAGVALGVRAAAA